MIRVPRKIKNPIREGLPSKIYLYAYAEPTTGYKIAGSIRSTTAKVYTWINKLQEERFLKKVQVDNKNKILSEAKPLLDEIEKELTEKHRIELSKFEKDMLLTILDSPEFRAYTYLSHDITDMTHDIDAVKNLTKLLSMPIVGVLCVLYIKKENPNVLPEPKTILQFNKILDKRRQFYTDHKVGAKIKPKFKPLAKETLTKLSLPQIPSPLPNEVGRVLDMFVKEESFKIVCLFFAIPRTLLEKLINLSPEIQLISVGIQFGKYLQQESPIKVKD